jgi:hypothetical protein
MTTDTSIFPPFSVPADLLEAAATKGWPEGLLQRAVNLGIPRENIDWWLEHGRSVKDVEADIAQRERLTFGTLRGRAAGERDSRALVDLYANSPEEIGDWDVTVERGPNPFAQFRLQENCFVRLLEDRGVVLAASAFASMNTIVAGRRLLVRLPSAFRVRQGFRSQGLSNLMLSVLPPLPYTFLRGQLWYIRSRNFNGVDWMKAMHMFQGEPPSIDGDVPGLPVFVHCYPARTFEGSADGIRKAGPADLPACVHLINRTHQGEDLFRPYSDERLENVLDEGVWGGKPDWWPHVYGWSDFYLIERSGRVVACAGLWDHGRDIREVWRHRATGEEDVIEPTALLDFGWARGAEAEAERLIRFLLGETQRLGRTHLMAPLQQLPRLASRLEDLSPVLDRRGLNWRVFGLDGNLTDPADPAITRPFIDLRYW